MPGLACRRLRWQAQDNVLPGGWETGTESTQPGRAGCRPSRQGFQPQLSRAENVSEKERMRLLVQKSVSSSPRSSLPVPPPNLLSLALSHPCCLRGLSLERQMVGEVCRKTLHADTAPSETPLSPR